MRDDSHENGDGSPTAPELPPWQSTSPMAPSTADDWKHLAPALADWPMGRMAREIRTTSQTISRWVREGKLLGPCLRRDGRAHWDPTAVELYRRQRLRRIGAE